MSRRLVVIGAGGHGIVVAETAMAQGDWQEVVLLDDSYDGNRTVNGFELVGVLRDLSRVCGKQDQFVVGIGDNCARHQLFSNGIAGGLSGAVVVHPSCVVSPTASVGAGTVVLASSVIAARTRVGCAVIVNHGAIVDHDCVVGDAVHISPGACIAGGVRIGRGSWLGVGATVIPSITIGDSVVVGASAAVVNDVADNDAVVGVPAKRMHEQTGDT